MIDINWVDKVLSGETHPCPDCGGIMTKRTKKKWRCLHSKCNGNKHTAEHVIAGNKEDRRQRRWLHEYLETYFKNRKKMYVWLEVFGTKDHIGQMDANECMINARRFRRFLEDKNSCYIFNELWQYANRSL